MGPWVVTQGNETGLVTYQGIPLASMGPWVVTQGNNYRSGETVLADRLASMGPWVVTQGNLSDTNRKVKMIRRFNGALGCNPGKYGARAGRFAKFSGGASMGPWVVTQGNDT